MKLVGKLQGVCMVKFAPEEVIPESGALQIPALSALLTTTYQLSQNEVPFQILTAGAVQGLIPQLVFLNGQYSFDDQQVSIKQIGLANNGISIAAQDTEAADKITDHVFSLLNTNMKFRFDGKLVRKYFSSIVVQFDRDFESSIPALGRIQKIIQSSLSRDKVEDVALKRLGFGPDTPIPIIQVNLGTIDQVDFLIERRTNQSFSENRYFSSAALKTSEHVRTLEEIEKTLEATS